MRHEPTDAPVPIAERVDVVEAMVRDREGDDSLRRAEACHAEAPLEVRHEVGDVSAGGRPVSAHRDIVLRIAPVVPRDHEEGTVGPFDAKHRIRCVRVELAMEPADALLRGRLTVSAFGLQAIDLTLNPNMCASFALKVATRGVLVEVLRGRSLDVAWARVVALDQVAVVAVHHPSEVHEALGRRGMQPGAERRARADELRDPIGDLRRIRVERARFEPGRRFEGHVLAGSLAIFCRLQTRTTCRTSRPFVNHRPADCRFRLPVPWPARSRSAPNSIAQAGIDSRGFSRRTAEGSPRFCERMD